MKHIIQHLDIIQNEGRNTCKLHEGLKVLKVISAAEKSNEKNMDKSIKRLCSICVRGFPLFQVKILEICLVSPYLFILLMAKESRLFDYIVVSSDCNKILEIAQEAGADLIIQRPKHLADDHSPKLPAIQHCLKTSEIKLNIKFDMILDLDATSPLRSIEDINGVVNMLEKSYSSINIITGSPSRRSPYFNLVEADKKGFVYLSGIKINGKK